MPTDSVRVSLVPSSKPKGKKPAVVPALASLSVATLQREQQSSPPPAGSATTTPSKTAAAATASPGSNRLTVQQRLSPLPLARSVAALHDKAGGASSPVTDSAAPTQRSSRVTLAKAFLSARVSTMLSSRRRKSSLSSTPADRGIEPPRAPHVWKLLPSQRARLSHEYHQNHEAISTFWGIYSLIHDCSISISPPLLEEALLRVGVHVLSNGDLEGAIASEEQFLMVVEDIMCDDRHADVYFERDSKLVELALTSVDVAGSGSPGPSGRASGASSPTTATTVAQHDDIVDHGDFGTRMINVAQLSAVLDRYHIGATSVGSSSPRPQQQSAAAHTPKTTPPPLALTPSAIKPSVEARAAKRTSLLTSPFLGAVGETAASNTWAPRASAADAITTSPPSKPIVNATAPFLEKMLFEFMSPVPHCSANAAVGPPISQQRLGSIAPAALTDTPNKKLPPHHAQLSRRYNNNDPAALRSDEDEDEGGGASRGALPAAIPLDFLCLALDRATLATPDPLVDFRPVYRGSNGGPNGGGSGSGGGLEGAAHLSAGGQHRGSTWTRARSIAQAKKSLTQSQLPPIVPHGHAAASSAAAATSPHAGTLQPNGAAAAAASSPVAQQHHHHRHSAQGSSSPIISGLRPSMFVNNTATVSSLLKRGDSMDNLVETALRECQHATANIIRRSTVFRLDGWDDDNDEGNMLHGAEDDDDTVLAKAFDEEGHFILGNPTGAVKGASSPHRQRRRQSNPCVGKVSRLDASALSTGNYSSPTASPRNYARPWATSPNHRESQKHGLSPVAEDAQASNTHERKSANNEEERNAAAAERRHRLALKESHRMSMKDLLEEVHQLSPAERRALTPSTRRMVALALRAEAATPQPSKSATTATGELSTSTVGAATDPSRLPRRHQKLISSAQKPSKDSAVLSPTAQVAQEAGEEKSSSAPSPPSALPSIRKLENAQWERWTTGGRTALPPVPHGGAAVAHGQSTKR